MERSDFSSCFGRKNNKLTSACTMVNMYTHFIGSSNPSNINRLLYDPSPFAFGLNMIKAPLPSGFDLI